MGEDTRGSGLRAPGRDTALVTVVMPVRNESATVASAIESVLSQSLGDLEVLVVDGASTDDTVERVRRLMCSDDRIRLLHNPDRTIPHALNIALAAARGRYTARVDAHARVSPTYLERGVAALEASADVAAVGGLRIGVATTTTGRGVAAALSSPFGVGSSVNHYGTVPQDTDHASFGVYRTVVLREVGGWREELLANEDVDIDHRIMAEGHRIRYDPEMLIYWHVRENLLDFGRQYRRYGRGKAAMVRLNGPSAMRGRHLAAPALVVGLSAAGALGLAGRRRAAAALALPYPVGVALAAAVTARRGEASEAGSPSWPALCGAFATMHLAWGVGFLEGLVFRSRPVAASSREVHASTAPTTGVGAALTSYPETVT